MVCPFTYRLLVFPNPEIRHRESELPNEYVPKSAEMKIEYAVVARNQISFEQRPWKTAPGACSIPPFLK